MKKLTDSKHDCLQITSIFDNVTLIKIMKASGDFNINIQTQRAIPK